MASKSVYPATSMNDFSFYCKKANFYDVNLPSSTVDRLFISANFEVTDQKDNPDKYLIRFEFIELLVRIARAKYQQPGIIESISEAFEKLIEEHVLLVDDYHDW